MDATREERLQMRQRGAGTRKIQQVDFGFSFGGAAIGPSDPAPNPLATEPAEEPQIQSAPTAATPPSSKVASQSNSHEEPKSQRTPGSARNKLPQRPSTFDIPLDERPTEQLSNKRRKPNPPTETTNTFSRRKSQRSPNGNPESTQNGDTAAAQAPQPETQPQSQPPSPPEPQSNEQTQQDPAPETNGAGPPAVPDQAQPPARGPTPDISPAPASGAEVSDRAQPSKKSIEESQINVEQPANTELAQTRPRKSRSPTQPNKSAKAAKGRSEKRASPKAASPTSTRGDAKTKGSRKRGPRSQSPEADQEPATTVGTENSEGASASTAQQPEQAQRPSRATKRSRTVEEVAPDAEAPSENAQSNAPKAKRPRGRAGKTTGKEVEDRQASPADSATQIAGEPSEPSKRKGRKAAKKAEAQPDPEVEDQDQRESPAESSHAASKAPKATKRQNRRAKKAQVQAQPEPEPEPEEEPEAEPEPEQPEEPEPAVSSGPSKSRRGRAGKKAQRPAEAPATTTEEQPEQAEEESSQPTGRKTRAPRGETVPVTIHRLANVSALGAQDTSVGSDEEGDNSGDEISARQKTKLPNRGGVNPADVLGQICRETLEKTLTTLKNGIANEANQNKRAEWTRKRKAVEAFGSELDGRLLDLSEMLDSNFVLGVQLKKAKREMMDLRGHLYRVRKEREGVALQMDAVRSKHMEEESAKTARNTINNSLHSLELALDRNQNRGTSVDAAPADIEFLLRTVANDVSSRAPGAQGGLLNQIRAFNTQLETTARRLERQ